MTIITKAFNAMFGFNSNALFVVYGVGLASECHWMIPGTWED